MTTAITKANSYKPLIEMVMQSVDSEHSRRAYARALELFLVWHHAAGQPALTKKAINDYREHLKEEGSSPATINQHLTAIKKLAREAVDNGLLDHSLLAGIENVRGVKKEGQRAGNWLSKGQAQRLLLAPDHDTIKGKRDRALLAIMLGCGLRRSEVIALTFAHIQEREGRWVVIDLIGKRRRVRSVPMPLWAKRAIDKYAGAVGINTGFVFRPLNRWEQLTGQQLSVQRVLDIVREYTITLGFGMVAPHDLRRTFAKLARNGGAALDQIQASLGHASVETTQRTIWE